MKNKYIRSLSMILINVITLFLLILVWGKKMETQNILQWGTLTVIGALFQTLTILLFYKYVDKRSFRTLRLKMNRKDLLFSILSIGLTAGILIFYLFYAARIFHFTVEWNLQVFSRSSFYLLFAVAAFAWFNAALTEEVLFRWYLVTNLEQLSVGKLYVVTSLFFMVSHVFKGLNPLYILFLLMTSCSLLYVYLRSGGKLLPVTFAHLAQNLVVNHLIGNSDIAILRFDEEPSILHLLVMFVLYNVVIIGLAAMVYKKEDALFVFKSSNNTGEKLSLSINDI